MARKKSIPDKDILTAAREVFVEQGFAASTRAIAKHAGVSEGLLFQRYPTKTELFLAAMVPPPIDMNKQLRRLAVEGEFETTLRELAMAILEYFRAAVPIFVPLMTRPGFRLEELAARHPQSALAGLRAELVRFFAVNKSPDPSGASLLLMSSLNGIAMFERLGAYGGRFPDEFLQRAIGCIWQAVRPASDHAKLAPIEER
ncbi:MAG TPA: helix-turn-helix domain-containing protein [Bryobacteraceae bacterium]|nr:helix-turn-helix domain-containing protein [Bryobacteraceae bacterium]